MKVVINRCFGGFGLSELAAHRLEAAGVPVYLSDIDRSNPILVAIVEELGELANDSYADLKVVEIPEYISWEIYNDDGIESIHEKHRAWY